MTVVDEIEAVASVRSWDATKRLISLSDLLMRANAQAPVSYTYDANSQLSHVTQGTLTATLVHDALGEKKGVRNHCLDGLGARVWTLRFAFLPGRVLT